MGELAQLVRVRVCAYLQRVTLDSDLAQDLTQEVLLSMVKSLKDLETPERFWPWIYRVAQSKVQEHYRIKQRTDRLMEAKLALAEFDRAGEDAADGAISRDLARKTVAAMRQIQEQYRAILALRCFDQLSYADIARIMDCTEVKARVLFYRAKTALRRQLACQGVEKYLFLACLGTFGKLTAPAEASEAGLTVAAAYTQVGLGTALLAAASSKVGLQAAVLASLLTGGLLLTPHLSGRAGRSPLPQRAEVRSIHYTHQSRNLDPGATSSLSKGAYEQWFWFPRDANGPVFMRMQRWDPKMAKKLCAWVQNGRGNYYYNSGEPRVYINNYHLWLSSLRVRELPTDDPAMTAFLAEVQGPEQGVTYSRDARTGLIRDAVDHRFVDAKGFRTDYQYNDLDETFFDYPWTDEVPVTDERDALHRQGFAWFKVKGRVGTKAIMGQGRLPFVYDRCTDCPALLSLAIGDDLAFQDGPAGARVLRAGKVQARYPAYSLFSGLPRPWMGMHCLDQVRRDAAAQGIWFATKAEKDEVQVCLSRTKDQTGVVLQYILSLEQDLIRSIYIKSGAKILGYLEFTYLEALEDAPAPAEPTRVSERLEDSPGIGWLFDLFS